MDLKYFKRNKKEKIILWSIILIFGLIALGNFIATSWYKFDEDMSKAFYGAMEYSIFRGWSAYTILDGYVGIVSFSVPFGLIIFESFWKWRKIKNKDGWFAKHYNGIKWVHITIIVVWIFFLAGYLYTVVFPDHGFGKGFNEEFLVDMKYLIPIFIVSYTINLSYIIVWSWYIRTKMSKSDDFLKNEYWKKSLVSLLFILICYIPVILFKAGFGRPYYYNLIWDQVSLKIKDLYPERYEHYINQTEFNYGWITPNKFGEEYLTQGIDGEWPWWKIGKGFFANETYSKNLPNEKAFPSGHIAATLGMCMTMYLFVGVNKNKKQVKWKIIGFTICLIYLLDVIFALQISLSHWWSDITFTLAWAPIALISSISIINGLSNKFLAKFN